MPDQLPPEQPEEPRPDRVSEERQKARLDFLQKARADRAQLLVSLRRHLGELDKDGQAVAGPLFDKVFKEFDRSIRKLIDEWEP
jgi:chromosome segregation ATPase